MAYTLEQVVTVTTIANNIDAKNRELYKISKKAHRFFEADDEGIITLTADQKNALMAEYFTIKGQLQALVGSLL